MIKRLRDLTKELWTPTALETNSPMQMLYRKAVVAIAHGVLGAGLTSLLVMFGLPFAFSAVIVGVLYAAKEAMDLGKAAYWKDSVLDTAATSLGIVLYSSTMLPLVLLAMGLIIFLVG